MSIFRCFFGASKKGAKKLPKVSKKGAFWEDFRLHLVTLEGHFGGHLGARVSKWSDYVDFFGVFFLCL